MQHQGFQRNAETPGGGVKRVTCLYFAQVDCANVAIAGSYISNVLKEWLKTEISQGLPTLRGLGQ